VGEGKSVIASNLALQRACRGYRTLLIDSNPHSPVLTDRLAADAKVASLDLTGEQAARGEAIISDASTGLNFLRLRQSYSADYCNTLGSHPMEVLLSQLRHEYEYIIWDLPSVSLSVEAARIAALIDAFIFVIRWGRTTVAHVEHALISNPQVEEKLIGCVLNGAPLSELRGD
jgi:Mrp family chromosome partitioning ATPase